VKYQDAKNYQKTIELSRYIVTNCPKSDRAVWAQHAIVMSNLLLGNETAARTEIDALKTVYKNDPNLPRTLHIVGLTYMTTEKYDRAGNVFEGIIQEHPKSPYADKSRLFLRGTEMFSLITSHRFADAQDALSRLESDFRNNPDLPEMLDYIARKYASSQKVAESLEVYQRISRNYPQSPYAGRAGTMDTLAALLESKKFSQAASAIDELIARSGDEPNLPGMLYRLARGLEDEARYDEAGFVYQQLVSRYPKDSLSVVAKMGIRRIPMIALLNSGRDAEAMQELDLLIADFKDHPHLPTAVILTAEGCFRKIVELRRNGQNDSNTLQPYFNLTLRILDIVINRLPASDEVPNALCIAGDCCYLTGRYKESLKRFQAVINGYPAFERTYYALYMAGHACEKLNESGEMPRRMSEPLITSSYERIVQEFGGCNLEKDAWRQLGFLHAGNNQWSESARCFEAYLKLIPENRCPPEVFYNLARAYDEMGNRDSAKKTYSTFIRSAMPTDPNRKAAKARLAELSKAD
jgi:TolA-binding protein